MRKAIIIGADPAGLRTAYKLLRTTDIQPVILDKVQEIGIPSREASSFKKKMLKILKNLFPIRTGEEPGPYLKELAQQIQSMGGKIFLGQQIYQIYSVKSEVCSIHVINRTTGELTLITGDYFLSSVSHQELIHPMARNAQGFTNLFLIRQSKA